MVRRDGLSVDHPCANKTESVSMSVTPLLFLRIHSRPAFEVRPDVNRKLIELACADPLIHRRLSMFALTSAEIINSLGFVEDRAI